MVIPNNYVAHKDFDRILTRNNFYIAVVHKSYIDDYLEKYDNRPYMAIGELVDVDAINEDNSFTPEWFQSKAAESPAFDEEAETRRKQFLEKYAPDKLRDLEGMDLLRTIFLNDQNKDNLCYKLEFDNKMRELFGSIKSGTAYKYGLHYSKKNGGWATGASRSTQLLTEGY